MLSQQATSRLMKAAARIPLLLVCVIAAIICNTLVAWGACVLHDPGSNPMSQSKHMGIVWPTTEGEPATGDQLHLNIAQGAACDWFDAFVDTDPERSRDWTGLPDIWSESIRIMDFDGVGVRAGWPCRSLYACVPDPTVMPGAPRQAVLDAPIIIGAWRIPWGNEWRVLPNSVLGWGTILNLLFYCVMFLALFSGPRAIRSYARRRSLRCEACGYPVGAFVICPECGREVA